MYHRWIWPVAASVTAVVIIALNYALNAYPAAQAGILIACAVCGVTTIICFFNLRYYPVITPNSTWEQAAPLVCYLLTTRAEDHGDIAELLIMRNLQRATPQTVAPVCEPLKPPPRPSSVKEPPTHEQQTNVIEAVCEWCSTPTQQANLVTLYGTHRTMDDAPHTLQVCEHCKETCLHSGNGSLDPPAPEATPTPPADAESVSHQTDTKTVEVS